MSPADPRGMEIQDAFLALFGLMLAVATLVHLVNLCRGWRRRTFSVTGTVVDHETRRVDGGDAMGMPIDHAVVRYEVGERSFVAVARYGATWLKVHPGERRVVVYDPRNPADGEVLSDIGRKSELLLMCAVPIAGVAIAVTHGSRLFG